MKQRLVGALVLLSLGVVLWSLLFTGNPMRSVDTSSQIPEAMRIDAEPPQAPTRPSGVSELSESWVPELSEETAQAESALPRDEPAESSVESGAEKNKSAESKVEMKTGEETAKPTSDSKPKPEARSETKAEAKSETQSKQGQAKTAAQAVSLDEQRILPKAWVVQVASFRSEESADGLKKKLQLRGYKAYVEKQSLSGRPLYRVMVGPKLNQEQAATIRDEIETEFRLKGLVMRFKR